MEVEAEAEAVEAALKSTDSTSLLKRQEARYNHLGPPAFSTKVLILMKVETILPMLEKLKKV